MLIDYYGIRNDWPGYVESRNQLRHDQKSKIMLQHTADKVNELFADQGSAYRFIPYVSMYEFEALLFSDPDVLASKLALPREKIGAILTACKEPEAINDNPHTAPSKRLKSLATRFKKTTTGIEIAQSIGIPKMRKACPLFDAWIETIESLVNEA